MKKVKLTLVILVILALAVFTLTACGNDKENGGDTPVCEHDYSYVTIKEPTCTEKGVASGVCSLCGDDTTKHIDSLGHDEVSHEAKAATCTENGYDAYVTCSRCRYTTYNASSETDALGHAFEKGNCSRCGETQLEMELSDDQSYYIVTGIGKLEGYELEIPAAYENKPVKEIANGAFRNCTSLTSVTIGNGVTSIGDYAFSGCTNLTSITVNENNSVYKSIDGNVYSKDGKTLILYAIGKTEESFNIPDGVTRIGGSAFSSCTNLTSIVIPDSVTSIGGSAFSGCTNLTSVTIGNGVTSIGDYAFSGCTNLTSVTIGNGVTSIGWGAFQECTSLESVVIPDSVTSISRSAFSGCTSLTSVVIPISVTNIDIFAFYFCTSLTSVVIPDSVTSIGDFAFTGCTNLTSVTIGNGVTSIGWRAFQECTSLESVVIPDSVTSIGNYAFLYCDNLTIYCEAASQPSGWNSGWNYNNYPVVWGYVIEE